MFVIAGLGNPRREYENTRHNIGFDVIDWIADNNKISMLEKKHKALIGKGYVDGQKVILVKPQTFMNLSGECLREVINYYKVDPRQELIVVYDDVSLDLGQLRIRRRGSAGGHNGIKNTIQLLGVDEFLRIKMGVGEKPGYMDLADYVLSRFTTEERKKMDHAVQTAAEAVSVMMTKGADAAMNQFNGKEA